MRRTCSLTKCSSPFGDVDEGAAALEYERLVTGAAGVGRHDWADIFSDPNIPFQYKHDLIAEIDANMRKPQ